MSHLDIIIPVKNEARTLSDLLSRIDATLTPLKFRYNIIIVDDHSTDASVSIAHRLAKKYPITVLSKQGKPGSSYSILQAQPLIQSPLVAVIDADLEYPPEMLPEMLKIAKKSGVVLGLMKNHTKQVETKDFIAHSGIKLLRADLLDHLEESDVTAWTFDLPLAVLAHRLGYTVSTVVVETPKKRTRKNWWQRSMITLSRYMQKIRFQIQPEKPLALKNSPKNMIDAGYLFKQQKFITHSTLKARHSTVITFSSLQIMALIFIGLVMMSGFLLAPWQASITVIAILTVIYFIDVFFNLSLVLKSLYHPPEIITSANEIQSLRDADLPVYTILCPLYKEAHMIPHFVSAIAALEWPKDKLDVIFLLEEDDTKTLKVAQSMKMPEYIRVLVVPDSLPKTKPKACNYGLCYAKGEYLVIFDAEDRPEPLQLKKVFLAFKNSPKNIKCVQAKLNYFNSEQNILTRFFTAEYSLWFDVILTGLQTLQTVIPLGGTSNHFKVKDLVSFEGWDPFNVTEDCDLGIRLFMRGGRTAVVDSVTLEEANSKLGNWLRQRSRWIKGYMQTYLLHMRSPIQLIKNSGWHAVIFHLTVGGKIAFLFINPLMWLLTIAYFALYVSLGSVIEALFPSVVFYMAVTSLIFGNFLFIYYYMIGLAKRGEWRLIKFVFLVPFYWLMASIAAVMALYQLIIKPHYWEKTVHGLHLKTTKEEEQYRKDRSDEMQEVITELSRPALATSFVQPTVSHKLFSESMTATGKSDNKSTHTTTQAPALSGISQTSWLKIFTSYLKNPLYMSGVLLIGANMASNVINMVTSIILGKYLTLAEFGVYNIFMSLVFLATIPISALGSSINYKTSYLMGRFSLSSLQHFWSYISRRVLLVTSALVFVWLLLTPFMPGFFKTDDILPYLLFAVFLLVAIMTGVNQGYLTGRMMFQVIALLAITQALSRLLFSIFFITIAPVFTYVAVILSVCVTFWVSHWYSHKGDDDFDQTHLFHLSRSFFFASGIAGLSSIAFFSLDNLLVAHYFSPVEVGMYSLLGLVGKMIFFVGSLLLTFMMPVVARNDGAGKSSHVQFALTTLGVSIMTCLAYVGLSISLQTFGHTLFQDKFTVIEQYIPLYGLAVTTFTISQVYIVYHLAKKNYLFPITALLLSLLQIVGIGLFHETLDQVVWVMFGLGASSLVLFSILHILYPALEAPLRNIIDFFDLFVFKPRGINKSRTGKQRILIFNWRDTKHAWAGGAEIYIHQVAKRLVKEGHKVTVFCGNDGHSPRNEVVDGVQIVRRGGFYMVYFWAFLYYVLKFRWYFDVIIDSENGIPFLTPLYSSKPIILLVHHIHQDVFREHLRFPLKQIAITIERDIMPTVYRGTQVTTVSSSSKEDILKLGLANPESIEIIHPGIPVSEYTLGKKSLTPSIVYLGRLKPYKNVDVLIKACTKLTKEHPELMCYIMGTGESEDELKQLVHTLKLKKHIQFLGQVSEQEKMKRLREAWVAVQPSSIEGWGITVIEANACGTAVIASNVKGLRDSVQDGKTGLLVQPRQVAKLVEALMQVLANKKLRTTLEKNARIWAEKFDWDVSVERWQTLIEYELQRSKNKNHDSSHFSDESIQKT